MVRKKIPGETKLKYAKLCFENKMSKATAAQKLSVDESVIRSWVHLYREQGALAFLDTGKNKVYSDELRQQAVCSYLNGDGSLRELSAKYGLRSPRQLWSWIRMYNTGEDFSHKMSGGSRMKASRETTYEERVKIAKECLANDRNYGEIAIKYNVSYQQVYGWVKRYIELGEAGLEDRRGRRKKAQEPRSKEEELQIENAQLKHELQMVKMERDLLKKVSELERKDRYRR